MALGLAEYLKWKQTADTLRATGTPENIAEADRIEAWIAQNASPARDPFTKTIAQVPVIGDAAEGAGLIAPDPRAGPSPAIYDPTRTKAEDLYRMALADREAAMREAALLGQFRAPDIRDPYGIPAPTIAPIERVTPGQLDAPPPLTAFDPGAAERYEAVLTGTGRLIDPSQIFADEIGRAETARAPGITAARIGPEAMALRGEQLAAARALVGGPSAAALQYQSSLAQLARETLGAAAQARGAERAGARREGLLGLAGAGIQGALGAAAEAAREELAKRQAQIQAFGGVRAADIEVTTEQARLEQQAASLEAQIQAEIAKGNMQAVNQLRQRQAELNLQARGMRADVDIGNVEREQAIRLANAAAQNEAARFGAAETNVRESERARQLTDVSKFNIETNLATSKYNLDQARAAAEANASAENLAALKRAELAYQAANDARDATLRRDIAQGSQEIAAFTARTGAAAREREGARTAVTTAQSAAELDFKRQQEIAAQKEKKAKEEAERKKRLAKTVVTGGAYAAGKPGAAKVAETI